MLQLPVLSVFIQKKHFSACELNMLQLPVLSVFIQKKHFSACELNMLQLPVLSVFIQKKHFSACELNMLQLPVLSVFIQKKHFSASELLGAQPCCLFFTHKGQKKKGSSRNCIPVLHLPSRLFFTTLPTLLFDI